MGELQNACHTVGVKADTTLERTNKLRASILLRTVYIPAGILCLVLDSGTSRLSSRERFSWRESCRDPEKIAGGEVE